MKKILKLLTVCFVICAMFTQVAGAASLTVSGTAHKEAKGVTILVLNKGVSESSFEGKDIVYINQASINSDGSFTITLPFLEKEYYDFYSNMNINITEDTTGMLDVAYVASAGSDSNDGTSEKPFATISKAYTRLNRGGKIVIKDSASFAATSKPVIIEGENSSATLTLPSEVSLQNDLTLSNITLSGASTIYANGHSFTVDGASSSTDRLSVYGGCKSAELNGNTYLTLLGGKYNDIYGGGYGAKVTGDTHIVLGGNANIGEGIDDDNTATLSPCMVYGGGNNGSVEGKTNVTLKDNAVAKYIVGAGTGTNGTAKDTNIYINGGKVMNVYAGSRSTVLPAGTKTHATITSGTAEAIFGGCESVSLTGHTFVNLLGGQVTRRVYSGCYNNVSFGMSGLSVAATWSTSHHVTGTTNLIIGPNVKLNTKDGLSSDNSVNVGVFSGSRMESKSGEEQNTLIYLDGAASSHATHMGEKSSYLIISLSKYLKSFEDYTVQATTNGTVEGTTTAGTIYVTPIKGYVASVNSNEYETGSVSVSAGTTAVSFIEKDFFINSVTANEPTSSGISGSADIFANNRQGAEGPRVIVAIYDETGLLSTDIQNVTASNANHTFNINHKLEAGKTYTVKAMIWDKGQTPLTTSYEITVK